MLAYGLGPVDPAAWWAPSACPEIRGECVRSRQGGIDPEFEQSRRRRAPKQTGVPRAKVVTTIRVRRASYFGVARSGRAPRTMVVGVASAGEMTMGSNRGGCDVAGTVPSGRPSPALRRVLIPLALAQFICSFAGSNMNVMINDISKDLNTTVQGVQIAITVFLLVMAALMIPGGKLTDRYGRVRLFRLGLVVYGVGAVLSAVAPGSGCPHHRQLDPRGRRHRDADPAGVHSHDAVVHRASRLGPARSA